VPAAPMASMVRGVGKAPRDRAAHSALLAGTQAGPPASAALQGVLRALPDTTSKGTTSTASHAPGHTTRAVLGQRAAVCVQLANTATPGGILDTKAPGAAIAQLDSSAPPVAGMPAVGALLGIGPVVAQLGATLALLASIKPAVAVWAFLRGTTVDQAALGTRHAPVAGTPLVQSRRQTTVPSAHLGGMELGLGAPLLPVHAPRALPAHGLAVE